jgi:hypothetical protein
MACFWVEKIATLNFKNIQNRQVGPVCLQIYEPRFLGPAGEAGLVTALVDFVLRLLPRRNDISSSTYVEFMRSCT